MKKTPVLYYLILAVIVLILPSGMLIHVISGLPCILWENEPIHSAIEAVGVVLALAVAMFLFKKDRADSPGRYFSLSMGFLGMGILNGFHLIVSPGNGFVMLHSAASLLGSVFFFLAWFPSCFAKAVVKRSLPWVITIGAMAFGLWTMLWRESLPMMVYDGQFTVTALLMNLIAGVLFLAAALRFLIDFHRSYSFETYLILCLALLFGLSSLAFLNSALWSYEWWLWHVLRVIAYFLVVAIMIHEYQQTARKLSKLTTSLEHEVCERTDELQKKVNELERFRKATVDREFRMKELRDELESMKTEKKGPA